MHTGPLVTVHMHFKSYWPIAARECTMDIPAEWKSSKHPVTWDLVCKDGDAIRDLLPKLPDSKPSATARDSPYWTTRFVEATSFPQIYSPTESKNRTRDSKLIMTSLLWERYNHVLLRKTLFRNKFFVEVRFLVGKIMDRYMGEGQKYMKIVTKKTEMIGRVSHYVFVDWIELRNPDPEPVALPAPSIVQAMYAASQKRHAAMEDLRGVMNGLFSKKIFMINSKTNTMDAMCHQALRQLCTVSLVYILDMHSLIVITGGTN